MLAVVTSNPYLAASIPVVAALVGWGGRSMLNSWRRGVASAISDAESDAKDDLIETLERNHDALVSRVEILESDLQTERQRGDRLERELSEKTVAFESLKQFAAPDGFARLETIVESNRDLLGNVLARLTELEERQTQATEALVEAVDLLRSILPQTG